VLLRAAIVLLLLLMVCPLLGGRAEAAISCTLTGPTLTFGTINIFSSSTTSGNATLTCTTTGQPQTFYACLSIGTGTGGTTATNRTLAFGSNAIPIQITGGASWPSQIGNGTSYPMEGVVSFGVLQNGSGSYNFPLVVTIPTPSSLPTPGTYASSFTGTDFQVYWDTTSQSTCAALAAAGTATTATGTFSASAIVASQCGVSATSMNFGSASLLTAALSATAQVSVSCNATLPVTIALDNGATGTGPTSRLMTAGSNTIQYGIYKDSGHSQPWGNTVGVNTAAGTGPAATLTAYGQVPAQSPAPTPGSYADVVGVTVTY
jgi:spore coat protein U-like protein